MLIYIAAVAWIFKHYFISFIAFIAITRWIITWKNFKTGEWFSREVETSQTREELSKRSASAMEKSSGLKTKSFMVRGGGFWNHNEDEAMNGVPEK